MQLRLSAVLAMAIAAPSFASAAPLSVPFDFSRNAIGLDVTVHGVPLYVILDTGVDPSVIDTAKAGTAGVKIDRGAGGEASGEGDAKQAQVYPATLDGLSMAGRAFAPFDALATDMSTLSKQYGRSLDGVLGYSFLTDKIVLVDYAARRIDLLDRAGDATPAIRACGKHWSIPLRSFPDDSIPMIPDFRLGAGAGAISLDTGSNGGIALYQAALDLPGVRAALVEKGQAQFAGARGVGTMKTYVLNAPVGFGPFTLPAGQPVTLRAGAGPADHRVANIGNKLFAAMKLKILFDYRARLMTFYGECRSR